MHRGAAFLAWVGLGLCGVSVGTTACLSHACTLIGCSDTETLEVTATVATVADTDISACLNQRCWHGHIAASDLFPSSLHGRIQLQADDDGVDGGLDSIDCTTDTFSEPNVTLDLTWMMWTVGLLKSGDLLTVTLTDATGNTVLSQSGTITEFSEDYPNGEDCDKVGCKIGLVKGTAAP
jgi:hypothetical protein